MNLLNLPSEVLALVAKRLDVASLAAFEEAHTRLRDVSQYLPSLTVKENSLTSTVADYLTVNRERVHHLDLQDADVDYERLVQVLEPLSELKTLKFTLRSSADIELTDTLCESLRSLRKLVVEIAPNHLAMALLLDLINASESLEECYVNIVGDDTFDQEDDGYLPVLDAARWDTLQRFVMTCHLSLNTRANGKFLDCVFDKHPSEEALPWKSVVKNCYIYERGHFSGRPTRGEVDGRQKFALLSRYHEVELSPENPRSNLLKSPFGEPSRLRIFDPTHCLAAFKGFNLNGWLTASLTELDIGDCHCRLDGNFKLNHAPNLESLVIAQCFIVPDYLSSDFVRITNSVRQSKPVDWTKLFPDMLSGLSKLKRLTLKAGSPETGCPGCRRPLESANFRPLKVLRSLEELNLDNVVMSGSAFEQIEHPNVHTVRMSLGRRAELKYLVQSLKRCPKLKNFKLDAGECKDPRSVWSGLAEMSFENLCLEMPSGVLVSKMKDCVGQILSSRTKVVHFHAPEWNPDLARLQQKFSGLIKVDAHRALVFSRADSESRRFPARSLCCSERPMFQLNSLR